ncbi:hypothetical protein SmJEL517_g05009 [Synchytrium microbalum]|uniref:Uncharacterized protein n=1 Tax=Synchytrium microbalum TaxID=1806994 RepID=A0A507BX63_9FUNG|nr:uncharacterized protein SmJEL517_g05009 [Synchytrium microbalum]TPX31728.1 hypothetical protein SmJEL517_g05009 [Synchytrium microbalum]
MSTPPIVLRLPRGSLVERAPSAKARQAATKLRQSSPSSNQPQNLSEQTSSATLVDDDYDNDDGLITDKQFELELERDRRENLQSTRRMLDELARKDAEWDARIEESDAHLTFLQKAVESGNESLIASMCASENASRCRSVANGSEEDSQLSVDEEDFKIKILDGLAKIKELDAVIKEKTVLAQSLTSARASTAGSSSPYIAKAAESYPTNHLDDDNDSSIDETESVAGADLKSITSSAMDEASKTRTFITEPKLRIRRRRIVVKRAESESSAIDDEYEEFEPVEPSGEAGRPPRPPTRLRKKVEAKVTSYEPGDFITRNMALGPDARYFSAMTDDEKARVNFIMAAEVQVETDTPDAADETSKTQSIAPIPELPTPFVIESRMGNIDTHLDRLSSLHRLQTPYSVCSASRDINEILKDDVKDLADIQICEQQLENLEQQICRIREREMELATRDEIERVLLDCFHNSLADTNAQVEFQV